MKSPSILQLTLVCGALLISLAASGQVAVAPYTISVFTTSIPGVDFTPNAAHSATPTAVAELDPNTGATPSSLPASI
jgi:hypothetical protein